ncbi:MAG: hypothetical protein QW383_02740 [Candidatus Nitrosocaldus sp.]
MDLFVVDDDGLNLLFDTAAYAWSNPTTIAMNALASMLSILKNRNGRNVMNRTSTAKCITNAGSGPNTLASSAKNLFVSYSIFLLSTVLSTSQVYAIIQKTKKKVVSNGCSTLGSIAKYINTNAIAIASIFLIGIGIDIRV